MTLHGRNVAVLRPAQQIPFPMAGNRSVFRFRRSFPNRDGIDDLAPGLPAVAGVSRAAHAPLRSQLVPQLFFQHSTGLNEQAAVDGFVKHSHALVIRILSLQPPRNLSGDQSNISLLATMLCNFRFTARRQIFGRDTDSQAWLSASWAR